ncbi:glycosyltransferase family 32 protein [Leuconostoc mesenteroides]|uniref:glycosyltransferase family 32 protein n=1 Tax=Leuconostoc mesenteroides TaxID=1245 RepID=UPI0011422E82|nr:glycosyltransferase [Leuconostoc mesenteroides]GEA91528.1 glycosyl transferase [Leuconostoc mesenteroides subsp. mesenteroides]
MIPKKIHYIWFGKQEKTDKVKECIKSWEKNLSDYEIIEWNESNFDSSLSPFVVEALNAKMFAFASDFVRLWVIYNYGGIYLDTDVEVVKSYDELLENKAFFGTEEIDSINTGLSFGAEKGNEIIKDLMDLYADRKFIEKNGSFNLKTTNMIVTEYFVRNGYKLTSKIQVIKGAVIYPRQYFSPIKWWNGTKKIEPSTYSIHWYSASWLNESSKSKYLNGVTTIIKHYIVLSIRKVFGYSSYEYIKKIIPNRKK